MTAPDNEFAGLTEEELATYAQESGIRAGENAETWHDRAKDLRKQYVKLASDRRQTAADEADAAAAGDAGSASSMGTA